MMKKTKRLDSRNDKIIWIGLLRIVATFLIFLYHLQGLYKAPQYSLDTIALIILLFISGYLIMPGTGKLPDRWLQRRFFRILIPYWLIMPFVIVANEIYQYKEISIVEYIISYLGGGLFLGNTIYVINWFITFILICYLFAYLIYNKHILLQVLLSCIFCLVFCFRFKWLIIYAFSFCLGFFYGKYFKNDITAAKSKASINQWDTIIVIIQDYTYYFFLLHAGVLQFFFKIIVFDKFKCFIVSLILTSLLCVPYRIVNNIVVSKITGKTR